MPIIVRPTAIWSFMRITLVATATGVFAVASELVGYYTLNENHIPLGFLANFLATSYLLPIGFIALFYKHLPRFEHGLVYAVSHVIAWTISGACIGLTVYPFDGGPLLNVSIMATAQVVILISTWLACRLFRGKVLINDGALCETCGYNLTGNVSGVCPECGTLVGSPAKQS